MFEWHPPKTRGNTYPKKQLRDLLLYKQRPNNKDDICTDNVIKNKASIADITNKSRGEAKIHKICTWSNTWNGYYINLPFSILEKLGWCHKDIVMFSFVNGVIYIDKTDVKVKKVSVIISKQTSTRRYINIPKLIMHLSGWGGGDSIVLNCISGRLLIKKISDSEE